METCLYGTAFSDIENLDPEKSVLLMIDMEKAFVEPGAALCIKGAKDRIMMNIPVSRRGYWK